MSLPPGLHSWRDMGSLANENGRDAPSHRECHYNVPGSAQTYTLWAWKHTHTYTHRWSEPCTYGDVYAPVSVEHAYSNWYVRLMNLCMLTHLHMSPAVAAPAVIRGDGSYATSLGSPQGRSHNVTGVKAEKCLSFSCHSPMTQAFSLSVAEVTFGLLHSWLCAHVTHLLFHFYLCFILCCHSRFTVFLTWIALKYQRGSAAPVMWIFLSICIFPAVFTYITDSFHL